MRKNTQAIYNLFLVICDCLAVIVAFSVAYILRVSVSHRALTAHVHALTYFMITLTLLPFWVLLFALLGLYDSRHNENRFSELGRITVGTFIGMLFVISYSYIANVKIFPARLVTLYGFLLATTLVFLLRSIARGVRRELFTYGIGINNVLLVGDTRTTHTLMESLAHTDITGFKVIGVVGGIKHPLKANPAYPQFQDFESAIRGLTDTPVHTIIQTELYSTTASNDMIVTYAQEHHIAYRFVPGNSELFVGNIQVDLFHSVPIITVNQTPLAGWGRIFKRTVDIVISGVSLLLFSPFILVIAVAIKLSDNGPVFYRQERLSRYNEPVYIYKFRSLKITYNGITPEEGFARMGKPELIQAYRHGGDHLDDDPRISPVGKFLRKTSLDEVPQLLNVLKGELSLVGPRALVPYELNQYEKKSLILSVKAGITGLPQISGVRDLSFEERRKLDLYYVQNWSIWTDFIILIKTFWVVLFHRGTRA